MPKVSWACLLPSGLLGVTLPGTGPEADGAVVDIGGCWAEAPKAGKKDLAPAREGGRPQEWGGCQRGKLQV